MVIKPNSILNWKIAKIIHEIIVKNEFVNCDQKFCPEELLKYSCLQISKQLHMSLRDVQLYIEWRGLCEFSRKYDEYIDDKKDSSEIIKLEQEMQDLKNHKFSKKELEQKLEEIRKENY